MLQGVVEAVVLAPTSDCPGGRDTVDAENGVGDGVATRSFSNGKDQIYMVQTTRDVCLDGQFQLVGFGSGIIVGGTGKYAGATGTWERSYTGAIQYADYAALPLQYFASVTGTSRWNIVLPD